MLPERGLAPRKASLGPFQPGWRGAVKGVPLLLRQGMADGVEAVFYRECDSTSSRSRTVASRSAAVIVNPDPTAWSRSAALSAKSRTTRTGGRVCNAVSRGGPDHQGVRPAVSVTPRQSRPRHASLLLRL